MDISLDEVIHFDAITSHPSTGAVTDADSTPTWSIFEEDTDTAILAAQNFTKRTSLTGNYRGSATLSAANGFEVGKWYNIVGSATVNAILGKAVVMRFRVTSAESIIGQPKVDLAALGGIAQSATDLKDFADDGYDPSTNKVQGVVLVDTISAYTGNTVQTANVATLITTVGAAGAGLTALGDTRIANLDAAVSTRATPAQVNTEVDTAIADAALATAANLATVAGYIDTEILSIITTLGVAGAGLTDLGGMSTTLKAQVESEVNDALTTFSGDTGVTLAKALELLAAFIAGKVSVSSAGGISTYTYKKRDGTTTSFTSLCSEIDGTRATTGSLS